MFNLIACVDKNGSLGYENELIFNYAEDMKLFREVTADGIVVMGRNTWFSLPEKFRPLPGRENIVISSQMEVDEAASFSVVKDIDELTDMVKDSCKNKWVIGGGRVYNEFLYKGLVSEIHLSESKTLAERADAFLDMEFIKRNYEVIVSIDKRDFVYNIYSKKQGK